MCIVIDVNGEEIIVPDETELDSHEIRSTLRMIESEDQMYAAHRKMKKERRSKRRKCFWERIFA